MMNNYNSLNFRTASKFGLLSSFLVGDNQAKNSSMQKSWFVSLMITLLVFTSGNLWSQIAMPYSETFSGITVANGFPTVTGGAWTRSGSTTTQPTYIANQSTYNRSGNGDTKFMAFNYNASTRYYFVGPFALTGGVSYTPSCLYKADGSAGFGPLALTYGTTAAAATQTNTIVSVNANITNLSYATLSGNFTPATTGSYYIAIKCTANGSPWYLSVDDFSMRVTPTCFEPTSLTTTALSTSTATISWNAPASAPALGYDYYYSTSNTAPTGATTPSGSVGAGVTNASLTGLNASTNYYFWVRSKCTVSDISGWSSMGTFYTNYCVPSGGASSTLYYLNSVAVTGGQTNFSSAPTSYLAYVNNTATSCSQYPGGNFGLSLAAAGGSTYYYYCWIDWNGDLDFNDAGETVVATTSYAATYASTTLQVPSGTAIGSYRMRVATSYSGTLTSCGAAAYGNYMDYTFNVVAPPTCLPPTALTTTGLSYTGVTIGWTAPSTTVSTGYEYYLATSSTVPTASTTATGSVGVVTSAALTGLTANTQYYYWVRSVCSATDTSSWSLTGSFYTGPCVPTSTYGSSSGTYGVINNVTINTLNHTTTGYLSAPYYVNYPTSTATTSVMQYLGYTMTVNTSGYNKVGAWFDWNNNLVFEASEFVTFTPNVKSTSGAWTATATVNVPGNAVVGDIKMRVATEYYSYTLDGTSACGPHTYGETKDYTVSIQQAPSCIPPSGVTVSGLTFTSANVSWSAAPVTPANGYDYYYSTNGTAPTGATTPSGSVANTVYSVALTGLTSESTYYFWVRSNCSNSDQSSWTAVTTFYTGYCVPSGSTTYYVANFTTTGGYSNINNTSGAGTGGYTNYSAGYSVSQSPGNSIGITITPPSSTYYYYVWVDWNNDLDFADAGEAMVATTSYAASYTGSIAIPSGQALGSYRMRIANSYSGAVTSSCGPASNGEFEDYTLNVVAVPTCFAPTALTASAITNTTATISWTAPTQGSPSSYDYYYSTNGTPPTASTTPAGNVAFGTNTVNLTGLTLNTRYYYWVRSNCSGSDQSAWSSTANFYTGACIPVSTYGSASYGAINNVTINDLNHTTTGNLPAPYYVNYPTSTATTTLSQQVTYNMSVNTSGYNYVGAWFDWNNNLIFESSEFVTFTPGSQTTSGAWTATANVAVPSTATLGYVRMRVATEYYVYTFDATSACGPHTYGETKDYLITVAPAPTCYPVSSIVISAITNNTATISWTAPTGGSPVSYEYEVRSSGAAGSGSTGLVASGSTTAPTVTAAITGLSANSTYKVYVRDFCGGSDYSFWTSSSNFKTLCDPSTVPYSEGFEGITVAGQTPDCMASSPAIAATGKIRTYIAAATGTNAALTPRTGTKFGSVYYSPNAKGTFFSAPIQLTAGVSYRASVFYVTDGVAWPTVGLYYGTAPTDAAMTNTIATVSNAAATTYTKIKGDFIPTTTGIYFIGFLADNTTTNAPNYCSFDDLSVVVTPTSVSNFTPSTVCSQGAETVTINGVNFLGATGVQFNGVNATSFTVVNNSQITAVAPIGVTAGAISVIGASNTGTSTTNLLVTNNPDLSASPITGGNVTTCYPTTVTLNNSTPSGVWSSSDTSIATVDQNHVVTPVGYGTATISYTVTNLGCSSVVTTPVSVNMPPSINVASTTASQTVVTGNNATFTVTATGTGLSYQWNVSTDGGTTFTPLTDTAPYSNTATSSMTITATPAEYNGYYYSCTITGTSPCSPVDSAPAILNVGDTGITTDPANVSLCDSGSATFTVVPSGTVNSYVWQEDQGLGFNDISNGTVGGVTYSGATSATLSLSGLTTANNAWNYRVVVTGPANSATSNNALLTVNQGVAFTTNPTDQLSCYTGGTVTFTAAASGSFTGYQWQYSADGSSWANVANATPAGVTYSGATTGSLIATTTASTPVSGTYYYRAVANASAPCANVNSTTAQLIINNPTVTSQPSAATVVAGYTATYTVAATASATPITYQWQYSTNGVTGWADVVNATPANSTYSGATTNTLSVTMAASAAASNANYYRAVITSNGCSVNSNGGRMTVATYCTPAPSSQDGIGITNVTIGTINNTSVSEPGYYGNYTSLSTNLNEGTTVPFSITYQTGYTYGTKIWIDFNKDGDFADAGEQVYYGLSTSANPTTLSGSFNLPIGTPSGVTRMRIGGTDTDTGGTPCYTGSYGTYEDYTVNIIAAPACSGTPTAGTASSSIASVCVSGTADLTASGYSTGVTGISFQWYNSAGAISGATSTTYTTPVLTAPETYYMRVTCANGGGYADTNSVTVGVYNPSITATTPNTRCGTGTTTLGATGSAGTTLSWYAAATGGSALGTGTSFTTPTIATTTNYYVEANIGGGSAIVGDAGPATSTNGTSVGNHGIMFTTTIPNVKIVSVDVPFTGTGTMTIALKNAANTTVISSVTTSTVTGNGLTPVTVPLNLTVANPGSYTLIMTAVSGVGSLGYDYSATFPYSALSGGFTVTSGYWYGADTSDNMYFFNLNVSNACSSARTAVTATVTPPPAFTISGSSAAICNGLSTTTPVTITSNVSDYDTYTWSPSTGVTGDSTNGYTFNPTSTTSYTLSATNATSGCGNSATYAVTVNALPSEFTVSPAASTVCSTAAPLLLSAAPVNPTPSSSACTEMGNGQYPSSTYTPTTCDGTTLNSITTAGYAGEYSKVNVSANTVYIFSSSGAGDYVTITSNNGNNVLAYGPSPLTWYSATAVTVRFVSENSSCTADFTSRTRGVICKAVDAAVFSPITGLYTNAAGTTAYTGTAVTSVYAKPTTDTTYTATVTNASGCIRTATASITINPASVAGTAAAGASTICSGSNTTISLTGYTGTIQWQQSANGTSGWSNIVGATSDSYTTANLTVDNYYRAVVTSGVCSSATSNVITITVSPTTVVGTASGSTTICSGSGTTLSLSGSTGTIQWQQSATGASGWTDISGATSATYATGNLTATTYYQAVVTSGACLSIASNLITVTVSPTTVVGTAAGSSTICSGSNATLSLTGSTGSIQWQQSANGTSGWTNISGATAASYTTANLTATTYYQAVVTSGVCPSATSNMITITVNPTSAAVMLSTNTAICTGSGITLSIGGVTGTIQWQQSADGSTGWSDISGATSASYATGNLTATTYYHAVVTSGVCPAFTTSSVRVQVNANVTYYADADHDGYGNSAVTQVSCMGAPSGYVANSTDCDDTRANTHPGAVDLCNDGIDNDCNGVIDNVGQPGGCAPVVSYVIPSQCGTTLSLIDNQVYAALIANAQGYRWKVTKMISGTPSTLPADIQMIDTSLRTLKLTQLTSYAFDTTYQIEIAVKINNNWQPYYGAACTITTPATTTTIVSTQCGTQLGLMTDVVYANLVSYAAGYRFKVTNLTTNAVQTIDRSLREFRFNLLSNIPYNTLFKVEVAVKNTNGTYLPYGPSCNVTTPLFPTTSLQDSQCDYVAASNNELVYAKLVANATNYRFNFTNTALSYGYTFDTVLRMFALNTVPGLTPNTTYSVKVAVKIGGVWGPYNKVCTLTTPGTVKPTTAITGADTNFNATAYPNPFAENFKLTVTTTSAEVLQVKVYDMLGKLIDNSVIDPMEVRAFEVGNNYPSGVYNVIVSQGDNIKTLRVIKR